MTTCPATLAFSTLPARARHNFRQPKTRRRRTRNVAHWVQWCSSGVAVVRAGELALGGDEEVDGFDDVDEEFVLAVLDAGLPPGAGSGARHLYRDLSDLVVVGRLRVRACVRVRCGACGACLR